MLKITPVLLAAALLGALSAPALAQAGNPVASTQFPPSAGNSSEGTPQTLNSMPGSAATAVRDRPGSDVATTPTGPTGETTDAPEG